MEIWLFDSVKSPTVTILSYIELSENRLWALEMCHNFKISNSFNEWSNKNLSVLSYHVQQLHYSTELQYLKADILILNQSFIEMCF